MKYLLYFSLLLLASCANKENDFKNFHNTSAINIKYNKIKAEKVDLPILANSTLLLSEIGGETIYFGDQQLREVFAYMPDRDSLRKVLGYGRGLREHNGAIDAIVYTDNELFIVSDIVVSKYKMDSLGWFNRSSEFVAWLKKSDNKDIAERPEMYTKLYDKLRCRVYNDTIYLNVAGNHPMFNPYVPKYFNKTRMIKGIPLYKGGEEFIFGRFNPEIKKQKGRHCFFMLDFDIDNNGNICAMGELDSLIYKYDHTFNVIECWGYAGKNMNFDEHKMFSMSMFRENYINERQKSHYRKIKCVDNYVFRSYVKSLSAEYDGLQIYEGTTLIADVDVPKGFNVIGKIGDWYYSEIMGDERTMQLWLYRFKL